MGIEVLKGKTLTNIDGSTDKDRLIFSCSDGSEYLMHHSQVCCESVTIDDVCGDWADLIGSPVLEAEES
jgi:hypothetical protein